MNRRNYQDNKLLLDTSFLLPVLGFETSKRVMNAFQKLDKYVLYYNEISILEVLWKIMKVIDGSDEEIARVLEGVRAIRKTIENIVIDDETVENAMKIYNLGHRDMIDNLLYSLAAANKLRLLTVDDKLLKFIEEHKLQKEAIITPEEI